MFTQINDTDLKATNGGMPNPFAVTGMTQKEAIADPEEFQARFDAWRAEHPLPALRSAPGRGLPH